MKEQHTSVKYTRSELDSLPDETDWECVDALTDEDIDAAASSDADDPPTDASFWKDATVVMPENMQLIRKKVILSLIDSISKSADAIAKEISQSLIIVENQLTMLVSDSICDEVSQDEITQYAVRKDVATFAKLAKEFLSNPQEHEQETMQYINSEYYLTRIDYELVDYVISRFYLDSVYHTDEDREVLRRILLVSPSSLIFALYDDTALFSELRSNKNQLDSSDSTHDFLTQTMRSQFLGRLTDELISDMDVLPYASLYATLQLRAVTLRIQVKLATLDGKYIETVTGNNRILQQAGEALRAGELVSYINPMASCYDGVAFLHLEEFQMALECFDQALALVQSPIQKAEVLNNKGVLFLRLKQYQKAIEYFEEGIALDSGDKIPLLRKNKQLAEECLTRAIDRENLNKPIQTHFVQEEPVHFEESSSCEFKEIRGRNPASRIEEIVDKYAVGFLNCAGGRIFWGIKDKDRTTVGVELNDRVRNDIREKVPNKLAAIEPAISPKHWHLKFHRVYDLHREIVEDLWVIELVVPPQPKRGPFYTGSQKLFVRDEGVTRELRGTALTEFILGHSQSAAETN